VLNLVKPSKEALSIDFDIPKEPYYSLEEDLLYTLMGAVVDCCDAFN
jgi:hypothetical protein